MCLIRIVTKTEKIHFRPESQRFRISPRPSPGQENRNWFNGSDEVKEKRNPSSLLHRVTVKLPADLTGPVDEVATGLQYLLCHCAEGIQQEMEGLWESCCWAIFFSCRVP